MDKCPNCGYEEPPIWRNRMWKLYQQYTRIDELEAFEESKHLADILKKAGPVQRELRVIYSDGYYNYTYKKDGFVIRISKKKARSPESMLEPDKEKSLPPVDEGQKRLDFPWQEDKKETEANDFRNNHASQVLLVNFMEEVNRRYP